MNFLNLQLSQCKKYKQKIDVIDRNYKCNLSKIELLLFFNWELTYVKQGKDSTGDTHGRIIKWTQCIGFLTLIEIAQIVESNLWSNSKEGYQEFWIYCSLAKFDYSLHFYFYESKQNKRVHVLHCNVTTIKEDCCLTKFFKTKYSV